MPSNKRPSEHSANRLQEYRISQISTNWDQLLAAHASETGADLRDAARFDILSRYGRCVHQYILAATRDHHVADDLSQEFALRFVRGDYKNAKPEVGRFRDYLKTSLRNLITDHFRRRVSTAAELPNSELADAENQDPLEALEADFIESWRKQVLHFAWESLKSFEQQKNNHFYTVLSLRAREPNLTSDHMAQQLSDQLGHPVTSDWVRQKLHRARARFAEFLVDEIRRTLGTDEKDAIADELAELGLQKYIDYQ